MAFTTAEKVDIRRFCGFGQFGALAGQGFAYRFFQQYGNLEYRLNNSLAEEEAVIRTNFLANIYPLETALNNDGVGANLDTDQAAVWHHNRAEMPDRIRLYNYWRRELCKFMGIKPGPGLSGGGNTLKVVV